MKKYCHLFFARVMRTSETSSFIFIDSYEPEHALRAHFCFTENGEGVGMCRAWLHLTLLAY